MKLITFCIPTFYGSESLVDSLQSIRNSDGGWDYRIILALDGRPLAPEIKKKVTAFKVDLLENIDNKGQMARIIQMIALVKTPHVILTQDDILFEKSTTKNIISHFKNNKQLDMLGALELPTEPKLLIEKVVAVGIYAARYIGNKWNNGDNYLMASGRCLAFKTEFLKSLNLPEKIINSDSYMYLATKKAGGLFKSAQDVVVKNPAPQTIQEHLKQSYRFSISQRENQEYINSQISDEFSVPVLIKLQALLRSFLIFPLYTPMYLFLTLYSKYFNTQQVFIETGVWKTDISTKRKKKV